MTRIDFYLDFISPYAWLAFAQLPDALEGLNVSVHHRPVLLGAMLKHHGNLGPAETPAKRDWTYRHVMWLGQHLGVRLRMPASHPFNPLPLLRLATAVGLNGEPSRWQCEQIFRHVWEDGAEANDPERLAALTKALATEGDALPDAASEQAKAQLKTHTDAAIAAGAFGVPAFVADGQLFWGLDSLPMLRAWLQGDAFLRSEAARPEVGSSLARHR
jgi:2-hydroxychromene-2-carboxylate isomerase